MPPQRGESPHGGISGERSAPLERPANSKTAFSTSHETTTRMKGGGSGGRSSGASISSSSNNKPPSKRPPKLVPSDMPLTPGEQAAVTFTTAPTLLPSAYAESVERTDRAFQLATLAGFLAWLVLLAAVLALSPPGSFERLDGVEHGCTILATAFLAVGMLNRVVPLIYRDRTRAFSGMIIAACAIQFIAMTTNALMIFAPTPVLIDPITGGRVHLMRWAEWAPLAGVMTFLAEGLDVPHPKYGMKIGALHGLCQGVSTLGGLFFPFATSGYMWAALMVNSCVLYFVIFVRLWSKRRSLACMKRGKYADEIEMYDRARLSYKLMSTCCFVWSVLIISYFVGWAGPLYYPDHPLLGSPALPLVCETFCELWSKVLNLQIIVDVHQTVFDESSRAERRLQELRSMMSAVWESSSDVIAISVKSHKTGDVTTMVSPTFVRLERAMEGRLKKDSYADGGPTKTLNGADSTKALVFELLARDLKIAPPRRVSSFAALAGLANDSSSETPHITGSKITPDDRRIVPKRVRYVHLSGIPTQTGMQHHAATAASAAASSAMYRPENEAGSSSDEGGGPPRPGVVAMAELLVHAWQTTDEEVVMMHDIVRPRSDANASDGGGDSSSGGDRDVLPDVRCEAKVTRLDPSAVLVVVRDVSERFRRFDAEKRVVMEHTAREKDAEANRFTRHEVKNGLLAAIGLCDSLREAFGDEVDVGEALRESDDGNGGGGERDGAEEAAAASESRQDGAATEDPPRASASTAAALLASASKAWQRKLHDSAGHTVNFDVRRCMSELDATLREVLDTILAQSMARDVMHEVYEPKVERVDMRTVLYGVRGCSSKQHERFPLVTHPSPLPLFLFDPQLLRFIHRNAISNACKYGKRGGLVMTEIRFDQAKSELFMEVINLPGEYHEKLVRMGPGAEAAVFEPGRRLHPDLTCSEAADSGDPIQQMRHSSGDGAWIMKKCANTMEGECSIKFEPGRTVFTLRCPAKAVAVSKKAKDDLSKFRLPPNTWGVAIDDSKIQRKLLGRFLGLVGIDKSRSIVLGEDTDEILGFVDQVVEIIRQNSNDPVLVIADENLDVEDEEGHSTVSGSRCVQRIRKALAPEEEKRMLALVRSANDSSEDIALYNARAHGYLLKAPVKKDGVMETIAPWWIKRFQGSAAIPSSESSDDLSAASDDIGEIEVSSAEILQTLQVIDALCTYGDQSSMAERWPVIWEKLHVLKGDLKTLKDNVRVTAVLEAIDRLQGPVFPEDFLERWKLIQSLAVSVM